MALEPQISNPEGKSLEVPLPSCRLPLSEWISEPPRTCCRPKYTGILHAWSPCYGPTPLFKILVIPYFTLTTPR